MTEKETYTLMMQCGVLHDIAEKTYDKVARIQMTQVQENIEKLIEKSEHINDLISFSSLEKRPL